MPKGLSYFDIEGAALSILRIDDLNFARRHLERFEDSDFVPRFVEYDAIWADWDNFSNDLMAANVEKLPLVAARAMPSAKGRSTYRIVHQIPPLTNVVYVALANCVGPALLAASADAFTATSNRFAPGDGALFSNGSGYDNYRERTEQLVGVHRYVATADVSDFFNQVYSHRVRASIEAADGSLRHVAKDMETVIHAINAGASKGIPVGSEASRLVAEGIMIDVDQLIARHGLAHTRYVDDIRIFANDEQSLRSMIEELSDYLYSNHRLNLNSQKTGVYSDEVFLEKVAPDHMDAETNAALARLSSIDPYGDTGADEDDVPDEEILQEIAEVIAEQFDENGYADQNLLKSFLRRCRFANSQAYLEIGDQRPDVFVPVFHELPKTLEHTVSTADARAVEQFVRAAYAAPYYKRRAVRLWLNWVCAGSAYLLSHVGIRAEVYSADIRTQARAATTLRDLAWLRSKRPDYLGMSDVDRMATMNAFKILGFDERKAIVGQLDERRASPVDLALKRWVLRD